MTPPRRILIIKPSSLGDVVHALPVLAALRRAWPGAHIAWLIGAAFAPLLAGHPLLDDLILFDRTRFGRMWRSPRVLTDFCRFVGSIRARRFDLVLDLQGLLRSGLIAFFSGAPQRVGFAGAREGAWLCYSRRVRTDAAGPHAVEQLGALCEALGARFDPHEFPLAVHADERAAARRMLTAAGLPDGADFVAVLPGARWDSKLWPAARFGELLDQLGAAGCPPAVLLGSPDEQNRAAEIMAAARSPVVSLVGRTSLRELVATLSLARVVASQDSGPMHIAAALGRPLVALFGPTNPNRTGPWSAVARVVQMPIECSPCYRRECPLGHHRCLRDLDAARVAAAVRESLAPTGAVSAGQ